MSAVDKARALLAKATPGPWCFVGAGLPGVTTREGNREEGYVQIDGVSFTGVDCYFSEDAQLIAAAPELLTALADEVEQLRAELASVPVVSVVAMVHDRDRIGAENKRLNAQVAVYEEFLNMAEARREQFEEDGYADPIAELARRSA